MPHDTVLTALRGVSRDAVEALVRTNHEPDWLHERRLRALAAFDRIPMPSRNDEAWRRTDLSRLRLEELTPFTTASLDHDPLPADLRALLDRAGVEAAMLVQVEGSADLHRIDQAVEQRGVIVEPLTRAVHTHPELVQRHLGTVVGDDAGKFEALNATLWSGGCFVYVPANVAVTLPIHAVVRERTPGALMASRVLLVAEANSEVTLVEEFLSPNLEARTLNAGIVEIVAGPASRVTFANIQEWGRSAWNIVTQRARVERDASFTAINVATGGRLHRAAVEIDLVGRGASGRLQGMVFGDGSQHFDHQTLQAHVGEHTTSTALFKTALTGSARGVSSGLIRIGQDARGTEAFLESRNMLLSEKARADAIPSLEILANDVRCKHAASVGRIDEEQLFYLMSRGIDRADAEDLIVMGFFAAIVDRIPLEWVRNKIAHALERRLAADRQPG